METFRELRRVSLLDESGLWQTFGPPVAFPLYACVSVNGDCVHIFDLPVCKAVSVDITSMEKGFLHRFCYTLINLLKPARPVSSTLNTSEKPALNPARIFSMNAGGKSLQPHS